MPLQIVRNDITHMHVDAIVNAANEHLRHGGGVCGAIFAAAGPRELQRACDEIGHCDTGSAVATPAFALHARHIIHTVGPVWYGGGAGEEQALRSCYRSSLALAHELGDESIAFPLISSGIYGYPKDQAIDVAIGEIRAFLAQHEMDVYLILFDTAAMRATAGRFSHITEYINDLYVREHPYSRRARWESADGGYASNLPYYESLPIDEASADAAETAFGDFGGFGDTMSMPSAPAAAPQAAPDSARRMASSASAKGSRKRAHDKREDQPGLLKRLLQKLDAPFSTTLMRMIDDRGLKDSDVYKRANLSRQHFSKIRSNPGYKPKKQTVLALAVALELSADETRLLLERAGFALTHADQRDIIVEYYIEHGNYDIYEINLALYAFDQPLLG
ncbi:MAG: macro domain-containing protein [Coriobacteriales bacterium]|nr:macro domain-containing protein [Coriobacteriales bacterium]